MKKRFVEIAVKVVVAALTAFLTAITTTSCMGMGPSWDGYAARAGDGLYNRADDQYGNVARVYRCRRPVWLGGDHGGRKTECTMGAYAGDDGTRCGDIDLLVKN